MFVVTDTTLHNPNNVLPPLPHAIGAKEATLWIKSVAGDPWNLPNQSVVACQIWHGDTPQKFIVKTISGNPDGAIILTVHDIIEQYGNGFKLTIVSDQESFWKAFDPGFNWIAAWKADGFNNRPSNNRAEWKALAAMLESHFVAIQAGPPLAENERDGLKLLKERAARDAQHPFRQPKSRKSRPNRRSETDWLIARAKDKDLHG